MKARWQATVVDCPEPRELATFYERLLGLTRVQDDPDFVVIGEAPDRPGLAFQRVVDYVEPTWPEDPVMQQMHLDVRVDDLGAAEAEVLSLGATPLPGGDDRFRVYADPAGHPFCLVQV